LHHDFAVSPLYLLSSVDTIFEEGDAVTLTRDDVAVETVVGHVSQATFIPPVEVLVARVDRSGPLLKPMKVFGLPLKKGALILDRVEVHGLMERCHKVVRADLVCVSDVLVFMTEGDQVDLGDRVLFALLSVTARSHLLI